MALVWRRLASLPGGGTPGDVVRGGRARWPGKRIGTRAAPQRRLRRRASDSAPGTPDPLLSPAGVRDPARRAPGRPAREHLDNRMMRASGTLGRTPAQSAPGRPARPFSPRQQPCECELRAPLTSRRSANLVGCCPSGFLRAVGALAGAPRCARGLRSVDFELPGLDGTTDSGETASSKPPSRCAPFVGPGRGSDHLTAGAPRSHASSGRTAPRSGGGGPHGPRVA